MPLDPSGATAGTITLAIRRHRASVGEAHSAIIALAGGPGQPALPFAEEFDELLGPIAATRDLIVFDQRGIGLSAPLSCHALERPDLYHSFGALVEACGDQLGPTRSFYTTADTVADIEAIRQAGGYEKLVLYGTSYGTKVAEEYAQEYPSHVEALVLDSVVPPNGPEPLDRPTFAAIPRILRQMCARSRLRRTSPPTPSPTWRGCVERMDGAPLRGRAIDGDGERPYGLADLRTRLVELLLAGDFSPLLRAEFVTAVAAAAGRRHGAARAADRRRPHRAKAKPKTSTRRSTTPPPAKSRTSRGTARSRQRPASPRRPPPRRRCRRACSHRSPRATRSPSATSPHAPIWPFTTPAPAIDDAPLPNVPTLILSGADDLRTPTAGAREVAAEIPDSHLLVVPYTGHSVLTDEPTSCASDALQALFAGHNVKPCAAAPPPASLLPPPLPPTRLALVSPSHGYSGLPGRTLHAVALTLDDFLRQLVLTLTLSGSLETSVTPNAAHRRPARRLGAARRTAT